MLCHLESLFGQSSLLAQNYSMAIGIVFLCLFLGTLVIVMPRPRKKYLTATEARDSRMQKVSHKRPAVAPKQNSPAPGPR